MESVCGTKGWTETLRATLRLSPRLLVFNTQVVISMRTQEEDEWEISNMEGLAVIALCLGVQCTDGFLYPGPRSKLTCFTFRLVFRPRGWAYLRDSGKVKGTPMLSACYNKRHDVLATPSTCIHEVWIPVFE
jgi:hypothetical protein